MFFSKNSDFSKKSSQFSDSKNSQVIQDKFVSSAHHFAKVKTGVFDAIASTGAIQKSSFDTNKNHLASFNN
jgi:hypothetical protein